YFAKLGADDQRGVSTRIGINQLDTALRTSKLGSLFRVFSRFSLNLYRRGLPLGAPYHLKTSTSARASRIRSVFGLATQYVPSPARTAGGLASDRRPLRRRRGAGPAPPRSARRRAAPAP